MPLNIGDAPGAYISTTSAARQVTDLVPLGRAYMLGTAVGGTVTALNAPTNISSLDDFRSKFGASSPSEPSVEQFFSNDKYGNLFFVNSKDPGVAAGVNKANYIFACQNAFDQDEHKLGILIAPEAFNGLTLQADQTAVQSEMEKLVADENFNWSAILDCSPVTNTNALATAQAALYSSPEGHCSYSYPMIRDFKDRNLPPSSAIAAMGLKKFRERGFNQPPAGSSYPLLGVKDTAVRVKTKDQNTLNPAAVNAIRYFPEEGFLNYGGRTLSKDKNYLFMNTRHILNVLCATMRQAFRQQTFNANEGKLALIKARQTAEDICYAMWRAGAFYGTTPAKAFLIVCNDSNNVNADIESGVLALDIYVVPALTQERTLIRVNRTEIGGIDAVIRSFNQQSFVSI